MKNTVLVTEKKISKSTSGKRLNKYIHKMMNSEDNPYISTNSTELALKLGVNKEVMLKRISGNRPLDRDYLIAICSQMHFTYQLTNKALSLAELPLLCYQVGDYYNERDRWLIRILGSSDDENRDRKKFFSIDEINVILDSRGLNQLDIKGRNTTSKRSKYKILETDIKVNMDYAIYDYFDSLEMQYSIDLYTFMIEAAIENVENHHIDIIKLNSQGSACKYVDGIPQIISDYKSTEYSKVLETLEMLLFNEQMIVFNQLNDTKNYETRLSAKFDENDLTVFGETFNFAVPETSDYLFVTYSKHEVRFRISKSSQFLKFQMNKDKYRNFAKYNDDFYEEFTSLEEVKDYYLNHRNFKDYSSIVEIIISRFENLQNKVLDLLNDIKNGNKKIRSIDDFSSPDYEYSICKFFNIEDKFNFKSDNEPYFDFFTTDTNVIEVKYDKDIIEISLQDVVNSFIYGLNNLNDICLITKKYGSISNWIQTL